MKSAFEPAFPGRNTTIATVVAGVLFFVLVSRLYYLQVVHGDEYVQKGQSNFVQDRRVPHPRGVIFDQAGRVLVDNRPSHDVYLTGAFLPDSKKNLQRLFRPLGLSKEEITDLDAALVDAVNAPSDLILAREGVAGEDCAAIEDIAKKEELRGVSIDLLQDGTCTVLIEAREFPSRAAVFLKLQQIVGLPADDMRDRVESALAKSRGGLAKFKPAVVLEDIGYDAYAGIAAATAIGELPGISLVDNQKRRYRKKALAAHVLGYMNEISQKELDDKKEQGYLLGDLLGRRGVEATHEEQLRGKDGTKPVVVDAKGRDQGDDVAEELLGKDRVTPPVPGKSLVLSLDEDMQRTAEDAFGGIAGSVVAMEVNTGFLLAMASFPTYDPNLVTGPWSKAYVKQLTADKLRPWNNKAIQEHYAPGSTFKAITAAAGLRNKLIDANQNRHCPGFFRLGRSVWRCFNRSGHGPIALVRALQFSCDTYFYSLGFDLGPDRLAETARLFGFGARTGLDLDKEVPGVVPDKAYYVRRLGAYTPGLVVNNSIGQGDVAVTPLQLAVAYAAIANGGTVYKPQIVREVKDADGTVLERAEPVATAQIGLDPPTMGLMKEALAHVTDPGGTASGLLWRKDRYAEMSKWLRESGMKLVGKTGTAQVVKLSKSVAHVDAKDVPYEQRDHAWFVAFMPYDNPEIVVVTMTEHGGFGGSTSGPVTASLMQTYFTKVRGHGRYAGMPPLVVGKPIVWTPPKKKEEPAEATEEHAPDTALGPDEEAEPKKPAAPVPGKKKGKP